jgi:hypothetical protein
VILIIAEPGDAPALWLRSALSEAQDRPVRLTTPVQLLCSRSIVHRLGSGPGRAGDGFIFVDRAGARIDSADVEAVVNRIAAPPQLRAGWAGETERRYAEEELYAFLLGWLASIDRPVLNPPSPDCLGGAFHGPLAWRQFAADSGLWASPAALTPGRAEPPAEESEGAPVPAFHFALDGRLIGPPLPGAMRDRLLAFAQLWGTRLLQIHSRAEEGRRRLAGATAFADYRLGGPKLVRAIARALAR